MNSEPIPASATSFAGWVCRSEINDRVRRCVITVAIEFLFPRTSATYASASVKSRRVPATLSAEKAPRARRHPCPEPMHPLQFAQRRHPDPIGFAFAGDPRAVGAAAKDTQALCSQQAAAIASTCELSGNGQQMASFGKIVVRPTAAASTPLPDLPRFTPNTAPARSSYDAARAPRSHRPAPAR